MIKITTNSLPNGYIGEEYDFILQYQADPEAKTVKWSVLSDLPDGLILNADTGEIKGTCKEAFFGSLVFAVKNVENDDKDQKPIILNIEENDMILIGSVMPYAGDITSDNEANLIAKGWQICDGREISRKDYADLFSIINVLYGKGDDVATFNLPDYRGQFLRGVSGKSSVDPNADTRTSQQNSNGGPGKAVGNEVGTFQQDDFRSHNHTLMKWSRSFQGSDDADKPYDDMGSVAGQTSNTGGDETRPKNVYVHYIIKFN